MNIKNQHVTDNFAIYQGDCVQLIKEIPDESIGFSIFSPPFCSLYVYSDNIEDMGNSKDYTEFLYAFNFLVQELNRVMMSGRNIAVHCMDLPIQKGKEGYIGLRDFSGINRQNAKELNDERHICPLQIDTIKRSVTLWSNKGDIVLSPFMGIGSEGYVALKLNRKFIGFELKQSYFESATQTLKNSSISAQSNFFID